jgi:hypothetical protein
MAELQRLSSQDQGDAIIQNMNGKMIEQLELTTARESGIFFDLMGLTFT